jgi:hypothetical protein
MTPHFARTFPPPEVSGGYAAFRPYVRADFRQCCGYCCLHEFWVGGERNFELDHYRPESLFPHLITDFYNLRYSCHVCNANKWKRWVTPAMEAQGVGIVDLTADALSTHYALNPNSILEPLTNSAEYTIALLRLNSNHLQQLRAFILSNSWELEKSPIKA